tara:strand:+ start:153 stop:404 length:252 start_codon:yes stop_codon:yes gene_type:complete
MIKEGTIVKGILNGATASGVITKTKTLKRKNAAYGRDEVELEITLAEVLFQKEGNQRAIYAYTNDEFHIIKDCIDAPAGLELA